MNDWQSMLEPAGEQAARIAGLWWLFLTVLAVTYFLVMGVLIWSVVRRRDRREEHNDLRREKRAARAVGAGAGATLIVLVLLLVQSSVVGRQLGELPGEGALDIQITAHQWWWEIRYRDPLPKNELVTANELHIPVGRPVKIELRSADVIHSFWVPNLHGKRDLIPSMTSEIILRADRPGIYRGQCAEFCGVGHAKMVLWVVAESQSELDAWIEAQRQPAGAPPSEPARRGRDLFVSGPCAMCHSVAGTSAAASNGPDLTHVASRMSLAAGSLSNTREHLKQWISDPQAIKPGNRMPSMTFAGEDLEALVAFLESLK